MKINKLIPLSLLPVSIASCYCFTSCNSQTEAQKVAIDIYSPLDTKDQTIPSDSSFIKKLNGYTQDKKRKELIYDLFGLFNIKGWRGIDSNKSFTDLYKDNKVSIKTNITHCEIKSVDVTNSSIVIDFLGYVSFAFNQDMTDGTVWKADDYVMLTYELRDFTCKVDNDTCSIKYVTSNNVEPISIIGIIKERKNDKSSQLYGIESLDTLDYKTEPNSLPTNYQNWKKA